MSLGPDLQLATIRLLEIHFEGYFMCRIATDPDPSNEHRGMSGYTMALPRETRLDQIIRLQVDEEFARKNARAPLHELGKEIGVRVVDARFDGATYAPAAAALKDARVELLGKNQPFADGPVFESRNNIVGNADAMAGIKTYLIPTSERLPGSRVLEGRFAVEETSIGVPKGHHVGAAYVRRFVDAAKSEGLVKAAIERAGIRGLDPAP